MRGQGITRQGIMGLGIWALTATAVERFPPPDFESGHALPEMTTPVPRQGWLEVLDMGVLVLALALGTWLVFRRRSRRGLVWLGVGCLLYFGFWRQGCVCAIGSVQNVALAFGFGDYTLPLVVLGFFLAPLLLALVAGRVFCSAVCPHGALQDLVLIKPLTVPAWLESWLRIIPYLYLATAVLLAYFNSAFLICRYDPFIGIFRLSGGTALLVFGGLLLVLAMFVGRPYCRFLCPYGALLGMCSRFSRWRVRITPDRCTNCHLCGDACPFGAIQRPVEGRQPEQAATRRRRLSWILIAMPLIVVACGWAGSRISRQLADFHPEVSLAEKVWRQASGLPQETDDALTAFRQQNGTAEELLPRAETLRDAFQLGGWIAGGIIGILLIIWLIQSWLDRTPDEYEADRSRCLACARCYTACPYEWERRGEQPPEVPT